jgi:hypothetical protein
MANMHNIIVDVSQVKFCTGPCNCKENECEPITLSNGKKHFMFKPYNGEKYEEYQYPLNDNSYLILKNVRICSLCNKRYLENWDEKDYETLMLDAQIICQKLNIKT